MKSFTLWNIRDGGFAPWLASATAWIVASFVIAGVIPGRADAGAGQNARETRTDRAEIAKDRTQLKNDVGDVRRFERLLPRSRGSARCSRSSYGSRVRTRPPRAESLGKIAGSSARIVGSGGTTAGSRRSRVRVPPFSPSGVPDGSRQQIFDLSIHAPELVGRPLLERAPELRVDA